MLEPVQRRRGRRRHRLRRLAPLAGLAALAVAAGMVVGAREGGAHHARAAVRAPAPRTTPTRRPHPRPAKPAALLAGPPLLRRGPVLKARSAILVDGTSGRVLYEIRAHRRRPIASTTKIMTALVALHRLRPHDVVRVDRSVPRVPLVKEGLRAGERVEAWKLFYGMLLYSGNDDALALAIAAGGSRSRFVALMNEEARDLGLRDTHFAGPSGIVDRDNFSTAWDLAALARAALREPRFRAIVRTRVRRVAWVAPTFAKIYVNKNLLLGRYRGANGVKTGFTTKAGHCLVASAARGRVTLIAVVLGSGDEYRDARMLLNLGFRALG